MLQILLTIIFAGVFRTWTTVWRSSLVLAAVWLVIKLASTRHADAAITSSAISTAISLAVAWFYFQRCQRKREEKQAAKANRYELKQP
jgi:uncharacterized membrane protein YccC